MSRALTRRSLSWLRLALLGATWLASLVLPRRDVVVQVVAAQAPARDPGEVPATTPTSGPPIGWRAAAVRTLPSHYYSFRAAMRRPGPSPTTTRCGDRELLIANGYDHTPQHLARVALRPAGDGCVPEAHPYAWSPRALHYSDVAAADFDRDGKDEIVVAAFAEVGGRMHTGGVYVIGGDDPWRVDPPALSIGDGDGYAPSSVAIGDLDADGLLDLVVGTFWRGPRGAGRDVKHVRGDELDGPTLWFRGLDPVSLTFAPPHELGPRGVIDVHLADLDRDGALDVITSGTTVTLRFGPDLHHTHELPVGGDRGLAVAPAVDVAWSTESGLALIAFTTSCFSAAECASGPVSFGVGIWAVHADREPREVAFWSTEEVPAPVRFVSLGAGVDHDLPALLIGVMTEPVADHGGPVIGRPYLGPLGVVGGEPLVLPATTIDTALSFGTTDDDRRGGAPLERLALRVPSPARPMASAIVPWAHPRDARRVTERVTGARSVLTYTGSAEVLGAVVHTSDHTHVPIHHVPGDSHVSLATPGAAALADGTLSVTWQVVDRPGLVITSACPAAGAAAGTLFVKPPEPARGSRDARWRE